MRSILVLQEKGGVLKTFTAVHLTTYLAERGVAIKPVDFDFQEGMISDVFPHPRSLNVSPDPVRLANGQSSLPQLMSRMIEGERFILDCGANTGAVWEQLFTETWPDLPSRLEKAGVRWTIVVPIDPEKKSRNSFDLYRQLFPSASFVLIRLRRAQNIEIPMPKSAADVTVDLPFAPEKLVEEYRRTLVPMDEIAKGRGVIPSFAQAYMSTVHSVYAKFEHLLV